MKEIKGMTVYKIASEMVEMGIYDLKDIMEYGYTEEQAKEIKEQMKNL